MMGSKADVVQESPLGIIKKRYARGEIDQETYERIKKELESWSTTDEHS